MHFQVAEDKDPIKTYAEYRSKLGREIDAYRQFSIKQINYMWLRDRLWFVKQLIQDFGRCGSQEKT